tara:strand:+ start:3528 stop:4292 length:765 start_codon:yes stop_codon:yes gene_type:complete
MSGIIYGKWGEQFQEHQYKRHDFGTKMVMADSTWVYAQMGGTVGVAGHVYQSEVPTSTWMTMTVDKAQAIGSKTISATLGATNATVEDEFDEGYVGIEDDAGEGFLYHIARAGRAGEARANAAAAAAAVQTVNLREGETIQVALAAATTLGFFKHKLDEVIIHPSPPTAAVVGVTMRAVTANYYCWLQVKGPAMVMAEGTLVLLAPVRASETTDGTVTTVDWDEANVNDPSIGTVIDIGATTEYATINLDIPGY